MFIRFRIWRERHIARVASGYTNGAIVRADIGTITVGRFQRGREI